MFRVFRVEDPEDHIGPFNGKHCVIDYSNNCSHYDNLPTWGKDFDRRTISNPVGAVLYPCQLFLWFGQDWNFIIKHFNIKVIEVRTIEIGRSKLQCIFDPLEVTKKRLLYDVRKKKTNKNLSLRFKTINYANNNCGESTNKLSKKNDARSLDRTSRKKANIS